MEKGVDFFEIFSLYYISIIMIKAGKVGYDTLLITSKRILLREIEREREKRDKKKRLWDSISKNTYLKGRSYKNHIKLTTKNKNNWFI